MGVRFLGLILLEVVEIFVERESWVKSSFGEEETVQIIQLQFSGRVKSLSNGEEQASIHIGEAPSLRPNSGVENTKDYIGCIIRSGPKTLPVLEAEGLRQVGGMEVVPAVIEGDENGKVLENGSGLRWNE
ncbi:hypothetical protein LguiB_020614 [Lonicera macranthoides]